MASKDEVIASKNEVIASKSAQLSSKDAQLLCKDAQLSTKDEVIASKAEMNALLSRTVEELQQHKICASSGKPADAAADHRLDSEQPSSKRQRLQSSSSSSSSSFEIASPLDKDEVLDQIFGFVGGGDHLYVGGVSRRWGGRYMQYCAQNSSPSYNEKCVTRQRSLLMSESRLQLAIRSGCEVSRLTFEGWLHAEFVCKDSLEPQQVLTILRLHGVPWSSTLCAVAARYCKLSLLQWLHASSCPWHKAGVLRHASRGGSVAVLEWLQTVTAPWSVDLKNSMLDRAAWNNHLAAAKWLLAQGAVCGQRHFLWAISSGSGWLNWKCEDYAQAAAVALAAVAVAVAAAAAAAAAVMALVVYHLSIDQLCGVRAVEVILGTCATCMPHSIGTCLHVNALSMLLVHVIHEVAAVITIG
eukprot:2338-Heterococcus_DN1.PRE.2